MTQEFSKYKTKKLTTLQLAKIYSEIDRSPTSHENNELTMYQKLKQLEASISQRKSKKQDEEPTPRENKELTFSQKAQKLQECGTQLAFKKCPKGHKEASKLIYANFCKLRLCPMCQWRKSLFTFQHFLKVAHKVQENNPNCQFIFITLTGKNVSGDNLSDEIDHYLKSFKRWTHDKIIKKAIKGTFRTLEITYNEKENTFHPHLHIIGVVCKSYFSKRHNYISQKTLSEIWKKAFQVDYTPIVDIRKIRKKQKVEPTAAQELKQMDKKIYDSALASAAAEVAKYTVKIKPLLKGKNKHQVIETLDSVLHNRRFIAYTGVFKEAYQQLKKLEKEIKEFELLDINGVDDFDSCRCPICQSELIYMYYIFSSVLKFYVSPSEKPEIFAKFIA